MQRLKISREGIVLIKSFEGFRPRALQREDGGWIIGYGHTLSAREGASVSEADEQGEEHGTSEPSSCPTSLKAP